MFSDFVTFVTGLPKQLMQTGSFLPDSFEQGTEHLQAVIQYISDIDSTYKIIGTVISLIIALLGCFFGYKLSRLFMSLTGLLVGAAAGGAVGTKLLDVSGPLTALCCLAGAVLLAILSYRIYQAGIFILCFGLSFMAAASIFPFTGDIQFFLSVATGFLIGMLALKFIRPVIIMTSAIVCGSAAAGLLIAVCEYMNIYTLSPYSMILMPVMIFSGCLVQFLMTSSPRH